MTEEFVDDEVAQLLDEMSPEELLEMELQLEQKKLEILETDKLFSHPVNEKQWEFINSHEMEVMFSGLNQQGKSVALLMDCAWATTGRYPEGFTGIIETQPFEAMIIGETGETVRDLMTDRLLGPEGERGTGFLPADCIDCDPKNGKISFTRGLIDWFKVKFHHPVTKEFMGWTKVYVRTYAKGYRRIAGYPVKRIWIDEEPSEEVYSEISARLGTRENAQLKIAESPTHGATPVWLKFFKAEQRGESDLFRFINYDIDDCSHLSAEQKETQHRKWQHSPLKSARLHGMAMFGEGLLYPFGRGELVVDPFPLAEDMKYLIGMDMPHGVGTFALVKIAYDVANDTVYVIKEYKAHGLTTPVYIDALLRAGGRSIPVAWPHDTNIRLESGEQVRQRYQEGRVNMLPEPAHFEDGSNAVMTVIEEICDRIATGRLKIFESCPALLEEMSAYCQKNGMVAKKQEDHLIDALHKAIMMLRYAEFGGSKVDPWSTRKVAMKGVVRHRRRNYFRR